jgi:hypothetical protein
MGAQPIVRVVGQLARSVGAIGGHWRSTASSHLLIARLAPILLGAHDKGPLPLWRLLYGPAQDG